MKEKELIKICDYRIERYYQKDFFIDLEYHDKKDFSEIGEVKVYIGDKTQLCYGSVMELASFKCYTYSMKPERVLDIVENILGNGLEQYRFYKHFLFQSKLEKAEFEEEYNSPYYEGDYYDYYGYSGQWHRKIKRDSVEKLKVERYKYGKYIFDIVKVKRFETSDSIHVDIYVLGKKYSGKLLCDSINYVTENDDCCKELLQNSYRRNQCICFYNAPSQIRLSNPEYEKIYSKPYDDSDAPDAPDTPEGDKSFFEELVQFS